MYGANLTVVAMAWQLHLYTSLVFLHAGDYHHQNCISWQLTDSCCVKLKLIQLEVTIKPQKAGLVVTDHNTEHSCDCNPTSTSSMVGKCTMQFTASFNLATCF